MNQQDGGIYEGAKLGILGINGAGFCFFLFLFCFVFLFCFCFLFFFLFSVFVLRSLFLILPLFSPGKSTFLKILAGVDDEFDGDINYLPGLKIGYLAQEPELNEDLTSLCFFPFDFSF